MKTKIFTRSAFLLLFTLSAVAYPGTFSVTNTGDTGAGTLRQAIIDAEAEFNAEGNPDTIVFNIPDTDPGYNSGTGVWTITPASDLPDLGYRLVIDGTSQTANQGDTNPKGPEIEINGTNVSMAVFTVNGSDKIIRGLVINRSPVYGILINGINIKISGNYIGTDATGTSALPNDYGIAIRNGGKHNLIGGITAEDRNVISGNYSRGILIVDSYTDSNLIKGNYIGTNASGDDTLCNTLGGIFLSTYSGSTVVGGTTEGERNVIGGSVYVPGTNIYCSNGITIRGSNNNRIMGNYIGTDKSASIPLYNGRYGILIQQCRNNTIGGTETGEGNVISGYRAGGIIIRMGSTSNNVVSGNFIGADPYDHLSCEECSFGIYLDNGAHDNIIGPGNSIMHNTNEGIYADKDTTVQNTITMNKITHNGGHGIYNANGANDSIATPVIQNVTLGSVLGNACAGCMVEIFSDSLDEGALFEGSAVADASGNFFWQGAVTGPYITATATDTAGNTSEFSEAWNLTPAVLILETETDAFFLDQNFPNPFSHQTAIHFGTGEHSRVVLKILDQSGRVVITLLDAIVAPGPNVVIWNGCDAAGSRVNPGVYYCTVEAGSWKAVRKLVCID